jgi:Stealth protein CR4, conserved region 4
MLRSDVDNNENLSWPERQRIMQDLEAGMKNEGKILFRKRNFYHVAQLLERAGLQGPKVNTDIDWTSLDGPIAIQNIDCHEYDVNECLAPGFSTSSSDNTGRNSVFSTALVFDRLVRQNPKCGDCLIKLLLNQVPRGLSPLLPHSDTQSAKRELAVKAVMRYKYTVINPDALFVMVTDAEQIDSTLVHRFIRGKKELTGQLCLNDDVATEDDKELADIQQVMTELYQGLFPEKSPFEL